MHDQPKGAGENACKSPVTQDITDQHAVLMHVLVLHPIHLPVPDLVRELTAASGDFAEGDAVERAVRDLTGIGLLHCPGGLVMPSHAAIRFTEITGILI